MAAQLSEQRTRLQHFLHRTIESINMYLFAIGVVTLGHRKMVVTLVVMGFAM